MNEKDNLDHVALEVLDIDRSVEWYRQRFNCDVIYQDSSWAMIQFGNIRLAFVLPGQHPPHIAFVRANAAEFGKLKSHRDGTRSVYIEDYSGNVLEIMEPY
jgi:catechol 2,3-dioxygenase-like lactoylglutathione lyase family enzyme